MAVKNTSPDSVKYPILKLNSPPGEISGFSISSLLDHVEVELQWKNLHFYSFLAKEPNCPDLTEHHLSDS